jgi:hypothetical protein
MPGSERPGIASRYRSVIDNLVEDSVVRGALDRDAITRRQFIDLVGKIGVLASP